MRQFARAILSTIMVVAGCGDPVSVPGSTPLTGDFVFTANLHQTPIATITVVVTATDISPPLVFNMQQSNGVASGTIRIPPGHDRTISVYAFNAVGDTTHSGSAKVNVSAGQNPPVSIPLVSRAGQQPVNVTMGPVAITIGGAISPIAAGETVQLVATIIGPTGQPIADQPGWATGNPAVLGISSTGLVTGIAGGTALAVATYAGVAASVSIQVIAFQQVSAGVNHSCGVTTNGNVYCWGLDTDGQLGDNNTNTRYIATPIYTADLPTGTRFTQVAAGSVHTCALTSMGDVYCWGRNAFGALGNNSSTSSPRPVLVQSTEKFSAVSAGSEYTCALNLDGRAYCWGVNGAGQLGEGSNNAQYTPYPVAGTRLYRSISAAKAARTTCAVAQTGSVYCWGSNIDAQLGVPGGPSSAVPVEVSTGGGRRYVDVSVGGGHVCAVATDGAAVCWGQDDQGELGQGSIVPTTRPPVTVTGIVNVSAIAAGWDHTCALSAGALYCWGAGYPSGSGLDTGTPTPLSLGSTFSSVSAGMHHTVVANALNQAFSWGVNTNGQVGNGGNNNQPATTPLAQVRIR